MLSGAGMKRYNCTLHRNNYRRKWSLQFVCPGRSLRPQGAQGPESPAHPVSQRSVQRDGSLGIRAGVGPEFLRSLRLVRSLRISGPESPAPLSLLGSWSEVSGWSGVSAPRTGVSGPPGRSLRSKWLKRLVFGEGYLPPAS